MDALFDGESALIIAGSIALSTVKRSERQNSRNVIVNHDGGRGMAPFHPGIELAFGGGRPIMSLQPPRRRPIAERTRRSICGRRSPTASATKSGLKPADGEPIVARIELQQSDEEVAAALGKPTPNAARVAVRRALAHLVKELDDEA